MISSLFPIVILAGGLATRLRPLTSTLPKALVDINGEPFIAHQLKLLAKNGIREVVMCLGYLGEQIVDVVGDGSQFGLKVSYSFDGEKLLGTAGAIKKALPLLSESFFVVYGDSYLPCNYAAIQAAFLQSQQAALMTVFHNLGQWDTSNIEFADGKILVYDKQQRTPRMLHIDYGLTIFKKSVFDQVPDNEACDLVPVYQTLLAHQQLGAYEVRERFYENGSHAGIMELITYLSKESTVQL
jgi:NDP-sugar pyrophosphorylase family protein